MTVFDGNLFSKQCDQLLLEHCRDYYRSADKLVIIQLDTNAVSERYTKNKALLCKKLGITCELVNLLSSESDETLAKRVGDICDGTATRGVIIQLPLPRPQLASLLNLIPVEKDIDMLSKVSQDSLYSGDFRRLPPVLRALAVYILLSEKVDQPSVTHAAMFDNAWLVDRVTKVIRGKSFYVIGDGFLVGRPIASWLEKMGAGVTVNANYKTGQAIKSDYLVLSSGIPNLVNGEDICKNCNVVDFGTSILNSKITGDLNKDSKLDHLGYVSLSPGGVGPVVVRSLIANFLAFIDGSIY